MYLLFSTLLSAPLPASVAHDCQNQSRSNLTAHQADILLVAEAKEGCKDKECVRLGNTVAPAKPDKCPIELYTTGTDVQRPFEKLCLLNVSTGSTLFSNKSPEEATKRLKKAGCKCGADAVILNDVNREGANPMSWGRSTAKGIGIRYTQQAPATAQGQQPPVSPGQTATQPPGNPASPQSTALVAPPPPRPTPSKPSADPYKIAKQTTVLIDGQNPGSGVIIAQSNDIYYVLTAKHVVATSDEYEIVTPDGRKHTVAPQKIKRLPKLDLAMVEFTSKRDYPVATLGNSDQAKQGMNIYVSGWPIPEQAITKPTHLVTKGDIVGLQDGDADGYGLLYGNNTAPGMSGGPILNAEGQVIGIHGRAAGNQESGKVGINLGMQISLFLQSAPQVGIDLQQLGLKAQK